MSAHVNNWLEAYYDGELRGRRLAVVEQHLTECHTCREELEKLAALSALLGEAPPAAAITRPEQFAAQVNLQLPRRPVEPVWQRPLRIAWYFVPLGLALAWGFVQAYQGINLLLSTASNLDLGGQPLSAAAQELGAALAGLLPIELPNLGLSSAGNYIPTNLGIIPFLGIDLGLSLVVSTLIGLLYLSWFAGWWVSQKNKSLINHASSDA